MSTHLYAFGSVCRGEVDPALDPESLPTRLRVSLIDNFGSGNQIKVF